MAIVVSGVMDGLDMREADETDHENAKQAGKRQLHQPRLRRYVGA
jgi:hypothetical protein